MSEIIEHIRARVAEIRDIASHDDEAAHSIEDELHRYVLTAIAFGEPQAAEAAKEALQTRLIKFARWCA